MMQLTQDARVAEKFDNYPPQVRPKIENLRRLVLAVAADIPDLGTLEETLKWGEPSYLAKKGSTIRIDWKAKTPDQYAMYFKCTSKLVATFREVFGDLFNYENNRAIVFELNEEVPERELMDCIRCALTYHRIKNIPALGLVF
ncbi:hypothetical protein CEQ90_18365 [Lewinellaceae bacterium SD302]|nr:hypothetical protein CEQ90_18365 [Lewinellaceae bacterium SD302]